MPVFAFSFNEGMLFDWALIIYGTTTDPLKDNQRVKIPTVKTTFRPETTSTTKRNSDEKTAISGR